MYKNFFIGLLGITFSGCSSLEDSEVLMKLNPEKRQPKHEHIQFEEQYVPDHSQAEKRPPLAPQVGVRIPLGK
jgi:hypothetical protein